MRLRLRIERNTLPPTQTLWPIDTSNINLTIAQLLSNINDTFPLESDSWGLEDYAVSIGGYDCLHYHELRSVCKDDDEVVVRPLQWVDVRARTLSGRSQISRDGRRLVDGVPFGKGRVRDEVGGRPEVRIPPRKKRRLDVGVEEIELEEEESDDGNFEEEGEDEEGRSSSAASSEADEEDESSSEEEVEVDSSSEDDSEDSSSSDSSSEESWNGLSPTRPLSPTKDSVQPLPNGISEPEQPPLQTTPTFKRKRELEDHHVTAEVSSPSTPALPGQGRLETKSRNARRRDASRLKRLKESGDLPAEATIAMMREFDAQKQSSNTANTETNNADATDTLDTPGAAVTAAAAAAAATSKRDPEEQTTKTQDSVEDIQEEMKSEKTKKPPKTVSSENDEFQRRREKLLADIEAGGVDVSRSSSKNKEPILEKSATDTVLLKKAEIMIAAASASSTPRSRLNLATSNRLVFSSLGVRVPKTQEEKDALQQKLAQRAAVNTHHSPSAGASPSANGTTGTPSTSASAQLNGELNSAQAPAAEEAHWSSKINLTAVECSEEGVILCTPPFPFHQRWDPQQRKKKQRSGGTFMQKGKAGKKRKHSEFIETYDKYNPNGGGDALEYDDAEAGDEEEYWEDGALLENGVDDYEADDDDTDDFPELPANIDSLPFLSETDSQEGDFIIWTELACNETTNWQPQATTRTAQIVSKHKDWPEKKAWVLSMSKRDRPSKTFDEDGNRVYSKFEMPDFEEEQVHSGAEGEGAHSQGSLRELTWVEMGEVRLLLREG